MSKTEDKRFEVIYQQGSALTEMTLILRDKETGAEYLFVQCGYAGGLTPLIDKLTMRKPFGYVKPAKEGKDTQGKEGAKA